MKNMILGMMGSLILINTLCICLCLLKYSPGVRAMRIQEKHRDIGEEKNLSP